MVAEITTIRLEEMSPGSIFDLIIGIGELLKNNRINIFDEFILPGSSPRTTRTPPPGHPRCG
jgi:hypothetical protein